MRSTRFGYPATLRDIYLRVGRLILPNRAGAAPIPRCQILPESAQ